MFVHNALIMMLHNTATNRWHPIFYYESPLPGEMSTDRVVRYKSKGHHTTGFDTREAALESCESLEKSLYDNGTVNVIKELSPDMEMQWDGKDIPADTQIRESHYIKMPH